MRYVHRRLGLAVGAILFVAGAFLCIAVFGKVDASDAVRRHLQGVADRDWTMVAELAPADELHKNRLDAERLGQMFRVAGSDSKTLEAIRRCAVGEPTGEFDGQAYFVLNVGDLISRGLVIEAARDADGNWKVPIYQTLYQVCRMSAGSLEGSLLRLAECLEAVGLDKYYVWQRGALVTASDLRLAAERKIDVSQIEKPLTK